MSDAPTPTSTPPTPTSTPPTEPPIDPVPGSRGDDRLRQVALGSVVVVATLLVLVGLAAVVARGTPSANQPADGIGRSPAAPSASEVASPRASGAPPGTGVASGDAVLVGAGDIADCLSPGDEATARLLDDIDGTVFTAGDNAYPAGSIDDFRECYDPSWGRHLHRTRPVPGNHDWEDPGLGGYLSYFDEAAAPVGSSWYAFELGSWHVVMLDSECGKVDGCDPDSEQGRWLAADLAANDAGCTVAIFHHPRFSSGEHGNIERVAPLWDALYAAGADLIVNGHDHDYERFAPQDPSGREDRTRGIRQFVVGTGGKSLREFTEIQPNSELRVSLTFGVLALTLREGAYDWRFHATEGPFSDAGTASCH